MDLVARLRAAGCVFAEEEARLLHEAADGPETLEQLVRRRVAGLPLEQVLGWAAFAGLRVRVEPGVFVPRRRTELLVREALRVLPAGRAVVVDLCCGSGAVGAALLTARPTWSCTRLTSTRRPCGAPGATSRRAAVHEGDLYAALPSSLRGRVDLLVANAPYVPSGAVRLMPPEARDHEPLVALDGGGDGVDVHRRIAAGALAWLCRGGRLLVETSEEQAPATIAAFAAGGFVGEVVHDDDTGGTVVVSRTPAGVR